MLHARPFHRPRRLLLAIALLLPAGIAGAQAPASTLHKVSSIGIGSAMLSSTGHSSVGVSGYYISAVNHLAMDTQISMFSEGGATSYGAMVAGGYAWGPFLNPDAAAPNFRSAMFFVGGGVWSSFNDVTSTTDPVVVFGGNAPIGPVMVKLGYGFVLAKEANLSLMNLGLGIKFGQK